MRRSRPAAAGGFSVCNRARSAAPVTAALLRWSRPALPGPCQRQGLWPPSPPVTCSRLRPAGGQHPAHARPVLSLPPPRRAPPPLTPPRPPRSAAGGNGHRHIRAPALLARMRGRPTAARLGAAVGAGTVAPPWGAALPRCQARGSEREAGEAPSAAAGEGGGWLWGRAAAVAAGSSRQKPRW